MKHRVVYLVLVITSLVFYSKCSVDLEKTGALLEVTPSQIRFTQKDTMFVVTVKNMGNEELNWNIQTAPGWLIFSKQDGELEAGVYDTFTVKYQKSLLDTIVEYREDIILSSNVNSATIHLIFQSEQPNLNVSMTNLEFGLLENTKQLTVSNTRDGFLDWKATPSVDWFSIIPDTGHTGAELNDTVSVTIHTEMLPEPGEYNGSIQINSDANGPFGTRVSVKIDITFYNLNIDQSNFRNANRLIFTYLSYNGNTIPVLTETYIQPVGQKKKCQWEIIAGNLPSAIQFSEASYKGSNCAKFEGTVDVEMTSELTLRVTDAMNSVVEQTLRLEFRRIEIVDPEMVAIPEGSLTMGDSWGDGLNVERPAHHVNLSAFQIGKFEVTSEQFYKFVLAKGYQNKDYWLITEGTQSEEAGWQENSNNGWYQPRYWSNSDTPWDTCSASNQPDSPVIGISWYEAYAYCKWLSSITNKNYNLPTEAQWERAARGTGDGTKYPWDNTWNESYANWEDNGAKDGYLFTSPVGSFENGKSSAGCYDMAGNVWEWCYDWYGTYQSDEISDPMGPGAGDGKVVRGGSWKSIPRSLRTISRTKIDPKYANDNLGFRIAEW